MRRFVVPDQGPLFGISLSLCELLPQGQSKPFTPPFQAISMICIYEVRMCSTTQSEADSWVPLTLTPLTLGTLYTLGPLLATYFELLKGIKERDLANRISSDGNDDRGG